MHQIVFLVCVTWVSMSSSEIEIEAARSLALLTEVAIKIDIGIEQPLNVVEETPASPLNVGLCKKRRPLMIANKNSPSPSRIPPSSARNDISHTKFLAWRAALPDRSNEAMVSHPFADHPTVRGDERNSKEISRKLRHNTHEKLRRSAMNSAFLTLKQHVPGLHPHSTKVEIMEKTVAYLKVIIHIANDMQRLVNEKCCSDGDAIQSRASSSVQLSDRRDADAVHEDNRNVKLELNFIQAVN